MINLLPHEFATNIRYGRLNTTLRRWFLGVLVATGGLILIIAIGWLYMGGQSESLEHYIATNKQQLESQKLDQVQKDASEISGDVKVINQVLSREISFSALMQDIGKIMPTGTVLNGLTLAKVDGAIDLTASARDYTSAAQVAINLSDPGNNIFSSIDIVSISCPKSSVAYKCSGIYKALFQNNAKNRYLGVASGVKQ